MEEYKELAIEVVDFDEEDVITSSCQGFCDGDECLTDYGGSQSE